MAILADLEVKQMQEHIAAGGFLSSFTDIFGNAQPAPKFQAFELNLIPDDNDADAVTPSDRIIMVRNSGNITSSTRQFFKLRPMLVLVVGKVGETDRTITNGFADDIEAYFVKTFQDSGCIANIESSGVTGPFITEDGRRAFEINITVMFNFDA